jgi:hypothetical protein
MISQTLHQLIYSMPGQNYWLNGCMAFLMECLGEDAAYDYWFFSGVTGDSFLQVYSKNPANMVLCYSDCMTGAAVKKAFDACGYSYEYASKISDDDRKKYDGRIRESIDKNIPVIARVNDAFHSFAIICGYGDTDFYYILGEETEPRIGHYDELIFVGEKKPRPSMAEAYRQAVMAIPSLIATADIAEYSFGRQAFLDWAESFQNGAFDAIPDDAPIWKTHPADFFSCWNMHGTYLCILGTNDCAEGFLQEALKRNPDMTFIHQLIPLFVKQNKDGFATLIQMENGFSIEPQVLKNKARMKPISDKIIEISQYCDEIIAVFDSLTY